MAKPTKYATPICLVLSLLAIVGIYLGLTQRNPLIIIGFILPAVLYEVYRTEGASTKSSSIGLLIIFILEIIFIVKKISFNLASYLQTDQASVSGYLVPLGDIRIVGPIVIGLLSIALFFRTAGPYTKWLAVIIFASALGIIYILDPGIFKSVIQTGVQQGAYQIY